LRSGARDDSQRQSKPKSVKNIAALSCVISGGQTGVDRAALDWALEHGLRCGGWCPKGRKAEDGVIPPKYILRETESELHESRTRANVLEASATLILNLGALEGGTQLTVEFCQLARKPHLIVQLDEPPSDRAIEQTRAWLQANVGDTLNIGGPRESKRPGVYRAALGFLERLAAPG
jgi:hypothetical protein